MSWKTDYQDSREPKLKFEVGAWKMEFLDNGEAYERYDGSQSVHFTVNATHVDTGKQYKSKTWVVYAKSILRKLSEVDELVGCVLSITKTQSDPDDKLTTRYKDMSLSCEEQEQLAEAPKTKRRKT